MIFGATFTGAGLAEDMQKGIIDRFRSLPMSRSAVLVGRTASDVVYNVLTMVIMAGTGLIVGWRSARPSVRPCSASPCYSSLRIRSRG